MGKPGFILVFFILSSYLLHANPKNDSVFNKAVIHSFLAAEGKSALEQTKAINETIGRNYKLFIFLSPECPLCQQASASLNTLYQQYSGQIGFYGVIPGKTYTKKSANDFADKYGIAYSLLIDEDKSLSKHLRATVTPQVILIDNEYRLVYKGAIDNLMQTLGKKRLYATEFYLADAIEKSIHSSGFFTKRTKAVGCSINDY